MLCSVRSRNGDVQLHLRYLRGRWKACLIFRQHVSDQEKLLQVTKSQLVLFELSITWHTLSFTVAGEAAPIVVTVCGRDRKVQHIAQTSHTLQFTICVAQQSFLIIIQHETSNSTSLYECMRNVFVSACRAPRNIIVYPPCILFYHSYVEATLNATSIRTLL